MWNETSLIIAPCHLGGYFAREGNMDEDMVLGFVLIGRPREELIFFLELKVCRPGRRREELVLPRGLKTIVKIIEPMLSTNSHWCSD